MRVSSGKLIGWDIHFAMVLHKTTVLIKPVRID